MPKRLRESDDVLEQLTLLRNDPLRVQQILESQDSATIAGIVTGLLNATISDAPNPAKHQKKAPNRPRMLHELFVEVMLFMDRDSLDSMQLADRFLLDYITKHEADELALRRISEVYLGDVCCGPDPDDEEHWLPLMYLSRRIDNDKKIHEFNCVHVLLPYLRLAYCKSVCFCSG
ncbi:hypothetical protein AAVH_23560 [Aphelenchoides avenae]|nr:hypothetical protein AAVH_23560 [Aphelenchus avenae]